MATLIFNSKKRDANASNNTISNASFPLKNPLCGKFKLGQVIIANSFYNIDENNRNIYIECQGTYNMNIVTRYYKVQLPTGYVEDGYALSKLITRSIQTTINNANNLDSAIYNTGEQVYYVEVYYDAPTNKLCLYGNQTPYIKLYFNEGNYDANFGETITKTAYSLMGFEKVITEMSGVSTPEQDEMVDFPFSSSTLSTIYPRPPYATNMNQFTDAQRGYFLVSTGHINLHSGNHNIYFQIKEADNIHTFSHSHDTFTFAVPLLSETGFYTHYAPDPNHNEIITIPNATKVLNVRIIDDDGALINMRGLDYTFTLIQQ